jgi:hypothetical protein
MTWTGLPESMDKFVVPEPNSGCWIWLGALRSKRSGYGSYHFEGKQYATHILAYKLLKGSYAANLQLDHLCRIRCCCNPDHLEPVTAKINLLRGESPAAKNSKKTHCPKGHPFTADNLVNLRTGERSCRTCTNDRARERARAFRRDHRLEDNVKKLAYQRVHRQRKREYHEFLMDIYRNDTMGEP